MRKFAHSFLLLTVFTLVIAGCSRTQNASVAANPDATAAADGNLAPVNAAASESQSAAQQPSQNSQPPYQNQAAPEQAYSSAPAYSGSDTSAPYQDAANDEGQIVYAPEAPPPLPEYTQPPCPGDNYIWTPGYWSYADAGYYWVPGVWVIAPYIDALWTPPYWDFYGGRYRWHGGYWGDHIGFYGGINYGFGYTGRGYYGGYWNGSSFAYNRAVTNVNVTIVHNVYERGVPGYTPSNRVSYNGGPGGINARPIPAELAVLHERRSAPVPAQVQHQRAAASDRAQFASTNRGRPTLIAQTQPLQTAYRAPAARPQAAEQLRPLAQNGPAREPSRNGQVPQTVPNGRPITPGRPEARPVQSEPFQAQNQRPEQNRPAQEARPIAPSRPAAPELRQPQQAQRQEIQPQYRPVPQGRPVTPEPRPAQQPVARQSPAAQPPPGPARPVPQSRPEPAARPTPQARPAQAPPPRPVPQGRPEPAARPTQEARPAPEARPAARPAPAPRPAPPAAHPEEKKEEHR